MSDSNNPTGASHAGGARGRAVGERTADNHGGRGVHKHRARVRGGFCRAMALAMAAVLAGSVLAVVPAAVAPQAASADAHRIAIRGMPAILTEGTTYNIELHSPCKGDALTIVERHSTAEASDTTWSDDTPDFELDGCGTRAITFTAEQDTDTDDEQFIVWIHSGKTVGAGNRGRVSPIYEFVIRDDDAKPALPATFNAAPQDGKAVLTWTKPVHPAVTTWELKQGTAAWATITPVDDATGTNSLKHEVTGLTNGQTYTFWLRGKNSKGTGPIAPSGSSGLAVTPRNSAYTPVSPPNVAAKGIDGAVELTWTQPSGGAIRTYGYRYRESTATSWGAWARTNSTAPRFTVGSLTNDTEYQFQIRAMQGTHVGPESAVATATPNSKPGGVGHFYLEGSNAAVMLHWGEADRATGYQYRQHVGTGGTTFGPWKDAGTGTLFEVTGLTNSSSHHFQVRAVNGAGGGPISDEIQSTPLASRVSHVRNLRLTAVGGTVIQIAWDAPARGTVTRYSYRHRKYATTGWSNRVNSTTRSASIGSLDFGSTYVIDVRPYSSVGHGPSTFVIVTTGSSISQPANGHGEWNAAGTGATVTWTKGTGTTPAHWEYRIRSRNPLGNKSNAYSSFGNWSGWIDTNTWVPGVTIGSLDSTKTYEVQAHGDPGGTNPLHGPEARVATLHGKVRFLEATTNNRGGITLTWSRMPHTGYNFGRYEYRYQPTGGNWTGWLTKTTNPTTVGGGSTRHTQLIENLVPGTTYNFQVRAVSDGNIGGFPEQVSATSTIAKPETPTGLRSVEGDKQVTLHWGYPTGADDVPAARFQYRHRIGTATWSTWADFSGSTGSTRSGIATGLTNGTAYTFEVRGTNQAGDGTAASTTGTPNAAQAKIYWGGSKSIRRANLDGSSAETLVTDLPGWMRGVAVDAAGGKVYWSELDGSKDRIKRANLDGSGVETLYSDNLPGNSSIYGVAVDPGEGKLYWVEAGGNDRILRSNLDGTSPEILYSISPVTASPNGIALDGKGNVYWVDNGKNEITKGSTSGSFTAAATRVVNLSNYSAIDLALDLSADRVYWSNWGDIGSVQGGIHYAKLSDGTGAGTVLTGTGLDTQGMALDVADNKVYWARWLTDQIRRANTTGSASPANVRTGEDSVFSMSLLLKPGKPQSVTATARNASAILAWDHVAIADGGSAESYEYRYKAGTAAWTEWAAAGSATKDGKFTLSVSGLTNDTAHQFQMRAKNFLGIGPATASVSATPTQPPAKPTGQRTTVLSRSIVLSWDDPGDSTITKWQVCQKTGADTCDESDNDDWSDVSPTRSGNRFTQEYNGLTARTTYKYRIRAHNGGGPGPMSDEASGRVLATPDKPDNLAAEALSAGVKLTWDNPDDTDIRAYQICQTTGTTASCGVGKWRDIGGSNASTVEHTVTGLNGANQYTFRIRAYNTSNSPASDSVTVRPKPGAVTLHGEAGDNRMRFVWNGPDPTTGFTKYQIRYNLGGAIVQNNWTDVSKSTQAFDRTNASLHAKTGWLEIRAVNASGEGAVKRATVTEGPAGATTGLTVTPGVNKVDLAWTVPTLVAGTSGTLQGFEYCNWDASPGAPGGCTWTPVPRSIGTTSSAAIALTTDTIYRWRVRAKNLSGPGTGTAVVNGGRQQVPRKPADLKALPGDGRIKLTWTDPGDDTITRWEFCQKEGAATCSATRADDWMAISDSDKDTVDHIVTGLTVGTPYKFQIRAVNPTGNGALSDTVTMAPQRLWSSTTPHPIGEGTTGRIRYWIEGGEAVEDITLTVSATAGTAEAGDFTLGTNKTLTIPKGAFQSAGRVLLTANADADADNETVNLSAAVSGGGGFMTTPVASVAHIYDSARPQLVVHLSGEDVTEGGTVTARLQAVGTLAAGATACTPALRITRILAEAGDVTSSGTSFSWPTSSTALTNPYSTNTITLSAIQDTDKENETLSVVATHGCPNSVAETLRPHQSRAHVLTVLDDDAPRVSLNVAPNPLAEGSSATVTASLAGPATTAATTVLVSIFTGSAAAGDFTLSSNQTLTIAAGATASTGTVTITANADTDAVDETVIVATLVTNTTDNPIAPESIVLTSHDDERLPSAPVGLTATRGNAEVTLAWTGPHNATVDKYQYCAKTSGSCSATTDDDWEDFSGSGASTRSGKATGLTNGQAHTFQIRAVNEAGNGALSAEVSATPVGVPLPAKPAGLTATARYKAVLLAWTDPGNSSIDKWQYCQKESSQAACGSGDWTDISGSEDETVSAKVTGLTAGTTYYFKIRAVNETGNGAESDAVNAAPYAVPDAPEGLTAVPATTQVTLNWTDPSNASITRYEYQYKLSTANWSDNWTTVSGGSATTTSTGAITGLTNDSIYNFRVRAVNASGNGAAATVNATPNPVPSAPTGLTATGSDTEITLNWTDPSNSSITKYQFQQSTSNDFTSATWIDVPSSTATTTSATLGSLANDQQYFYKLRAVNPTGNGAASAVVDATPTDTLPAKPAGLTVAQGDTKLTLNWTASTNTSITKWQYQRNSTNTFNDTTPAWVNVTDSTDTTTSAEIGTLDNDTTYWFRIRSVNSKGNSPASDSASGVPRAVPVAPTGLSANPGTSGQMGLSWTDPSISTLTGYEYQYSTSATFGDSWTAVASSGATTTTATVTGLTDGTKYWLRIRAKNPSGAGAASSAVTAIAGAPKRPTDFTASPKDGKVDLAWTDPSDSTITSYQYCEKTGSATCDEATNSDWTTIPSSDDETVSYTVPSRTNNTTYKYRLRAVNTHGAGPPTAVKSARPIPIPAKPTGLASVSGNAWINLSWNNPSNSSITRYEICQKQGSDTCSESTPGDWSTISGSGSGTTTHGLTGQTNNVTHYFRIRAVNPSGPSPMSDSEAAQPTGPPAKPSGLNAAGVSGGVKLTWTNPNNTFIRGYEYCYQTGTTASCGIGAEQARWTAMTGSGASTVTHTITGLTGNTQYTFRIRAYTSTNSPASDTATATPAPGAVTSLRGEAGDNQVKFTWSGPTPANSFTGYQVRYTIGTVTSSWSARAKTVTSLTLNDSALHAQSGWFEVRAVNSGGNGAATRVSVTEGPPGAVSGETATPGVNSVVLTWTVPTLTAGTSGTISSYEYCKWSTSPAIGSCSAGTPGDWTTVPNSTGATNTVTVSVTDNNSYHWRVRARNLSGPGTASNIANAGRLQAPAAPANLTANPQTNGAVRFSWNNPGNSSITGYEYNYKLGTGNFLGWIPMTGSGPTTTQQSVSGTNGQLITFRLRAKNAAGTGAHSETSGTPNPLPSAPTGLGAVGKNQSVDLSWTIPADTTDTTNNTTITKFQYRKRTTESDWTGIDWQDIPSTTGTSTSGTVTGLTNNTAYTFHIRAVSPVGKSSASGTASATPQAVPWAPTGLRAAGKNKSVELSWTAPSTSLTAGAPASYEYCQSEASTETCSEDTDWASAGTSTTHTVTGLTNGTTYYFRVRGTNSAGDGAASGQANAAPAATTVTPTTLTLDEDAASGTYTVVLNGAPNADVTITPSSGTSGVVTFSPASLTFSTANWSTAQTVTVVPVDNFFDDVTDRTTTLSHSISGGGFSGESVPSVSVTLTDDDVIVSNLDEDESLYSTFCPSGGDNCAVATSFTTGNNTAGYTFTSATVHPHFGTGNNSATVTEVAIYANGSTGCHSSVTNCPGSQVGSDLTGPTTLTRAAHHHKDVVYTGSIKLAASTTYWLVFHVGSPVQARTTTSGDQTSTDSWTIGGDELGLATTWRRIAAGDNPMLFAIAAKKLPAAPTGLTATAGSHQVTLNWADPSNSAITKYQVCQQTATACSETTSSHWTDIPNSGASTTSYVARGLSNGTTYRFEVRAFVAGPGPASNEITKAPVLAAPDAPTGLAATARHQSVELAWTALGDSSVTNYQLCQKSGSTATCVDGDFSDITSSATTTSYTVDSLTNGQAYAFRIRAVNSAGNGTASDSATATPRPRPAAPTSLSATAKHQSAELSWTAPSGTVTDYEVCAKTGTTACTTTGWVSTGSTTASHTVGSLTNNTQYYFWVRAVNSYGKGTASNRASATPVAVPAAPTGFTATGRNQSVYLAWTDPDNDSISRYQYRQATTSAGITSATWTNIPSSDEDTVSYTVPSLTNGNALYFQIRAVNSAGNGAASATKTATPVATPAAPTALAGTGANKSVALTWTAPAGTVTDYEVCTKSASVGVCSSDDWSSTGSASTGHTVSSLTNGLTYYFRVRAVNTAGKGAESAQANAAPVGPPAPPTSLSALGQHQSVDLSWTAPAGTITGYEVCQKSGTATCSDSTPGDWSATSSTSTTYTVTGLTNGTSYKFKVRAVNGTRKGESSAQATATPVAVSVTPSRLTLDEDAASGTYTVRLGAAPTGGNAVITPSSGTSGVVTFSPATLTFTAANWGTAQTVTVVPTDNYSADLPDRTTTISHSISGGGFGSITIASVTVTLTDDDVIVSNLSHVDSEYPAFCPTGSLTTNCPLATDFTTGTNAAGYTLTSATIHPHFHSTPNSASAAVNEVAIYTNSTTNCKSGTSACPGTRIGSALTGPTTLTRTTHHETDVTWTTSGIDLAASTRYWLLFDAAAPIKGYTTRSAAQTSTDAWTIGDRALGGNSGTWQRLYAQVSPLLIAIGAHKRPAAPSVTATAGNTQVTLTWSDPSNAEIVKYQICRKTGSASCSETTAGDWSDITGSDASTVKHIVTGLTNGTTYKFEIRAVVAGPGPASDEVTGQPAAAVPATPSGFSATARNASVDLAWTDPEDSSIDEWEYCQTSGASAGTCGTWTDITNSTATTTSYTVPSLDNGTQYWFRLRAVNTDGDGTATAALSATPVAPPAAPTDLSASTASGSATLTWTAPTGTIGKYQFQQNTSNSFTGIEWTDIPSSAALTSYAIGSLTNGTTYYFRLRAVNDGGNGAASSVVSATPGRPAKPSGFTATAGDAEVSLSWTNPSNSTITEYEINQKTGAADYAGWTNISGSGAATVSHKVESLANGTVYKFKIRAVNANGNGTESDEVTATPLAKPSAPGGFTATAGNTQVVLAWTNPNNTSISRYEYQQKTGTADYGNWTPITGSGASTVTYTVGSLTNGTEYRFKIRAVNASGNGAESAEQAATPPGLPAKPGGFTAAARNGGVYLSWTDPSNSAIDKWQYQYKQTSTTGWTSSWTDFTSNATTTSVTVSSLSNGTSYDFRIRAVTGGTGGGAGPESDVKSATPAPTPAAPTGLTAQPASGQVTVNWTGPSDSSISEYEYRYKLSGASWSGGWTDFTSTSATRSTGAITGLSNGSVYNFEVRGVNPSGNGTAGSVNATPNPVPSTPGSFAATAKHQSVELSWTTPSNTGTTTNNSTITEFQYQQRTTESSWTGITTWTKIPSTTGTSTSGTISSLENGTAYTFRIRAVSPSGNSTPSGDQSATPLPVPAAPTGLTATPKNASVDLSWTAPSGTVTDYDVCTKTSNTEACSGTDWVSTGSTGTTKTVGSLPNGTTHYFRVRAVNSAGDGAQSDQVDAQPFGPPAAPSGFAAAAGNTQVTLSWDNPSNATITKYQYQQAETNSFTDTTPAWQNAPGANSATATSSVITGLGNGTTYYFRVRAVNASGDGTASSVANAQPGVSPPSAPTGLAAFPYDTSVTLSWTDPQDSSITGYKVRHSTSSSFSGATLTAISGSSATTTAHSIGSLTKGDTYYFQLVAVNSGGDSTAASASATPGAPDAPYDLAAAAGNARVTLTWGRAYAYPAITKWQYCKTTGSDTCDPGTAGDWDDITGDNSLTRYVVTTGLTNGTTYKFQLRAVNSQGNGAPSAVVSAQPAAAAVPATPSGFGVAGGDASATLSWSDPGDTSVTAYQYCQPSGRTAACSTGDWTAFSPAATGSSTSGTVSSLTNGTAYWFRVRAVSSGGGGAASEALTVTPLGPPTGLAASVGDRQTTLSWTAASGAEGYQFCKTTGAACTAVDWINVGGTGSTASHVVRGLTNDTTYTFRLRSVRDNGVVMSAATSAVTVTPTRKPGQVTGLTARSLGATRISLSWTAPASSAWRGAPTDYEYCQKSGTDTCDESDATDWTATSSTTTLTGVSGLTEGVTYTFQVRARNGAGVGAASNTVSVTPAAPPSAPASVAANPTGNQTVTLSWTASTDSSITSYQFCQAEGSTATCTNNQDWMPISGSDWTTSSHEIDGLDNGTQYAFRVRAVNSAGTGTASGSVSATARGTPAAPTGVAATSGVGQIMVRWTAPVGWPITGYQYCQKTDTSACGSGDWTAIANSATATSHTVTGLSSANSYRFRVRAVNGAGNGDQSARTAALAPSSSPAPAQPQGLRVVRVGDGSVTLEWTWTAAPGAGNPLDQMRGLSWRLTTDGSSYGPARPAPVRIGYDRASGTGTFAFTRTGLTNGQTYTIAVQAEDSGGPGIPSATVTATPTATPPPATPDTFSATTTGDDIRAGEVVIRWGYSIDTLLDPNFVGATGWQYELNGTWHNGDFCDSGCSAMWTTLRLEAGTTYVIRVRTLNGTNPSAPTTATTLTTKP